MIIIIQPRSSLDESFHAVLKYSYDEVKEKEIIIV
jgi:hypothetical protein